MNEATNTPDAYNKALAMMLSAHYGTRNRPFAADHFPQSPLETLVQQIVANKCRFPVDTKINTMPTSDFPLVCIDTMEADKTITVTEKNNKYIIRATNMATALPWEIFHGRNSDAGARTSAIEAENEPALILALQQASNAILVEEADLWTTI